LGDVTVETGLLNHPGGAMGYRVNWQDRSVAYITDTEHFSTELDRRVVALADRADVLIYDCTYTDEEYPSKVGWGHSTWQEGVKIAIAARVKKLVIFHHDPSHNDEFMDSIGIRAADVFPQTIVAREGMELNIDLDRSAATHQNVRTDFDRVRSYSS
jgi:phosphoribosyl 1,2-cyclic phosphodiesterase